MPHHNGLFTWAHVLISARSWRTCWKCRHVWPDAISLSLEFLLRDLDERFWRSVEEQELREELLLDPQLAALAYHVDVEAELQQEVGHRQLDEHDAERQALQPHADEAADDEHERHVQTDHPKPVTPRPLYHLTRCLLTTGYQQWGLRYVW